MAISFGSAASFCFAPRTASASAQRQVAVDAARELAALAPAAARRGARPRPCAPPSRAAPALRHSRGYRPGSRTARAVQPSFSRAPLISSAPSGEPCELALAGLGRRADSRSWCGRRSSSGGRISARLRSRAQSPAGSCPSMRARRPAGRLEALHLIDRVGERQAGRRSRCRCRRTARSAG